MTCEDRSHGSGRGLGGRPGLPAGQGAGKRLRSVEGFGGAAGGPGGGAGGSGAEWPSAAACVGGAARGPGGVAGLESIDGGPGAHVDTTLITGHDLLSFGASIDA